MNMNLIIKQSHTFKKAIKRLSPIHKKALDETIRKIAANPALGEKKRGDLDFVRVYKFRLDNQEILLGYMYEEVAVELILLKLGSHENFYRDLKKLF